MHDVESLHIYYLTHSIKWESHAYKERNLLSNMSLMSHILSSLCWRIGSSSLVWCQCPWHTLSSHNGVIVIPHTLKVETLSSGLSLNLSHPSTFLCRFQFLSLLLLHSISNAIFLVLHPKLLTFPLFNLLSSPLLRWCIRPPAATHTHTLHYLTGAYVWASLSAWSSNIQVLAQSKQPCLRCKGYNSAGIRGRIWTGGTNKPQARLPSLSLLFFFFGSPFLILSLFPCSQFIKSQLIFQGVWSGEWEEGIANR